MPPKPKKTKRKRKPKPQTVNTQKQVVIINQPKPTRARRKSTPKPIVNQAPFSTPETASSLVFNLISRLNDQKYFNPIPEKNPYLSLQNKPTSNITDLSELRGLGKSTESVDGKDTSSIIDGSDMDFSDASTVFKEPISNKTGLLGIREEDEDESGDLPPLPKPFTQKPPIRSVVESLRPKSQDELYIKTLEADLQAKRKRFRDYIGINPQTKQQYKSAITTAEKKLREAKSK